MEVFKNGLKAGGIKAELGPSQIIPLKVASSAAAVLIAERLGQRGIYAAAVRPPTVPPGGARLRFSITNHLAPDELAAAAAIIAAEWQKPEFNQV